MSMLCLELRCNTLQQLLYGDKYDLRYGGTITATLIKYQQHTHTHTLENLSDVILKQLPAASALSSNTVSNIKHNTSCCKNGARIKCDSCGGSYAAFFFSF